ncbi:HAD family hydrolase [Phytohabitans sp. LJ34]|uniref:HAD family hydrolase n=1 Tax=Phytohabitans sp. LJ34 TaxID=3452217 RepID=UPI003F8BE68A
MPHPHRFSAVLLDFDRTLFAFDDSVRWPRTALSTLHRDLPPDEVLALHHRLEHARQHPDIRAQQTGCQRSPEQHRRAHTAWFQHAGIDPPLAEALYNQLTGTTAWIPYADTADTITRLHKRGIPVAIVSNVGWNIRPLFEYHGLASLVDSFVLSCEHGTEKPDTQLFSVACANLGVHTAETLMVGDDPVNDGAATAIGISVAILPRRPMGAERGLGTPLAPL